MRTHVRFVGIAAGICLVTAVLVSTSAAPIIAEGNGARSSIATANHATASRGAVRRSMTAISSNSVETDAHAPTATCRRTRSSSHRRWPGPASRRCWPGSRDNKNADDPLFRPVDADDFRVNGDNASDFSNLVENGLVRVTMPLPANVKLIDPATGQPSAETSVDLWRAVMPVLNVAITGPDGVLPIWPPVPRVPILGQDPNGPNRQGGYQHDARFATLQEQARGALFAHAQVTVEPPAQMLDDLAAFQQTLFSSRGVERLARAILSGSPLPDPDPELNELEQQGKAVFNSRLRHMPRRHVASEHVHARRDDRAAHRALSQHPDRVSAPGDRRLLALSTAARAQRAHVPNHARQRHHPNRHDLGSWTIAAHGPTRGSRRDGRHATPRHRQDRPVLPQQLRRDTRGSARPLRRVLQDAWLG